jgi:polar amino acid transport system substrate-binding protein/glutamate/aspartate transport system substrate-binding protein
MRFVGKLLLFAAVMAAPSLASAAGTLDHIKETGVIRLGVREDAAPFAWRTDQGGIAGYSVDLCVAVAKYIKHDLKMDNLEAELVIVTAADRFDAVADGKIDLLCEATSATLSRREKVDFSLPTYIDGASVLERPDGPATFKELAGHKIGVLTGTTTQEALGEVLKKEGISAEVIAVDTHDEGLDQLKTKKIDAYFADRTILQFMLFGDSDLAGYKLADSYFTYEPYAIALPLGDSAYRLAVDRALSRIYRSSAIEKIFQATFQGGKPSDALRYLYLITPMPE